MILRLAVLALFCTSCSAGEYAVLASGFRLHADRHETDGAVVKLYTNGGVTEFPAEKIKGFEADEVLPAPVVSLPILKIPTTDELIAEAAKRNGLPVEFVKSVVAAESAFRPDALSPKGAVGLMQLMPSTAKEYGAEPTDPKQNVEAGTQYLRDLLLKYQHDDHQVVRALAAYNAGPGAVDRYHGVPPYRETIDYINRVLKKYAKTSGD